MKAEEIINSVKEKERNEEENLKLFFPSLYIQQQTDKNISFCLKELKNDNDKRQRNEKRKGQKNYSRF